MRRLALPLALLAAVALAVLAPQTSAADVGTAINDRTWRSAADTGLGVPPTGNDGAVLSGGSRTRVYVDGLGGTTITGGSVCGYYQAPGGSPTFGDGGFRLVTNLTRTVSTVRNPDGGAVNSVQFADIPVEYDVGRIAFVSCGLTGAIVPDDGGTPRWYVTTEVGVKR